MRERGFLRFMQRAVAFMVLRGAYAAGPQPPDERGNEKGFLGGKGDILSQDCVSVCLHVQELHSNILGNNIFAQKLHISQSFKGNCSRMHLFYVPCEFKSFFSAITGFKAAA